MGQCAWESDDMVDPPLLDLGGPYQLLCPQTPIDVMVTEDGTALSFSWTGPNGYSANSKDLDDVLVPGTYTLTARYPGSNCTLVRSVEVTNDVVVTTPIAINMPTITCRAGGNASVKVSIDDPLASFVWSGPPGFSGTNSASVSTDIPGSYSVEIRDRNNCPYSISTVVNIDKETPTVQLADITAPNCTTTEFSLEPVSVRVGHQNVAYSWTGPNRFNVGKYSTTTSQPGEYRFRVTDRNNGCTTDAFMNVDAHPDQPTLDVTVPKLNCEISSGLIDVTASDCPTCTFEWTRPNGSTSNSEDLMVDAGGVYALVANAGSCLASAQVRMVFDTVPTKPSTRVSMITCDDPGSILLRRPGQFRSIRWIDAASGNVLGRDVSEIQVTNPGQVHLEVIDNNACPTRATIEVTKSPDPEFEIRVAGTLDCFFDPVRVTAAVTNYGIAGIQYNWNLPDGSTRNTRSITLDQAGEFSITVEAPGGCTTTRRESLPTNFAEPEVTAIGGAFSCVSPTSVQLTSSIPQPGLDIEWTGPNNFVSDDPSPSVTEVGVYTLTVTGSNGCIGSDTALVYTQNTTSVFPSVEIQNIGCVSNGLITLGENASEYDLSWRFLDSQMSEGAISGNNLEVTEANNYIIEALHMQTGCYLEDTFEVTKSPDPEFDLMVADGTLDCFLEPLQVTAAVTNYDLAEIQYVWNLPDGSILNTPSISLDQMGEFSVTVEAPGGCMATKTGSLPTDFSEPEVTAVGGAFGCGSPSSLQLTSSIADQQNVIEIQWTGPNNFLSNEPSPSVTDAGIYTLTVRGRNGCVGSDTALVQIETTMSVFPTVEIQNIDCVSNGLITLGNNASEFDLSWRFLDSQMSEGVISGSSLEVTEPGSYIIEALHMQTGCYLEDTFEVIKSPDLEFDLMIADDTLDCFLDPVQVTAEVSNYDPAEIQYVWNLPDGSTRNTPAIDLDRPGQFSVTVEAPGGCLATKTDSLPTDFSEPEVTAIGGGFSCVSPNSVQLTSSIPDPVLEIQWSGPNNFLSNEASPSVTDTGVYMISVTGSNGCIGSDTALVQAETMSSAGFPAVEIQNIGCASNGLITIGDNASEYDLSWRFLDSQMSEGSISGNSLEVSEAESYIIEALHRPTGCYLEDTVEVATSADPEFDLVIAEDTLNCLFEAVQVTVDVTNYDPAGIQYAWNLPDGSTLNTGSISLDQVGEFSVTVEAPGGCMATKMGSLPTDLSEPEVTAVGGSFSCVSPTSVLLTSSIPDQQNVLDIQWTGPNNFLSNESSPSVTDAGVYTITVTGRNGCIGSDTALVQTEITASAGFPTVEIEHIGCVSSGLITVSDNASEYDLSWRFSDSQMSEGVISGNSLEVFEAESYIIEALHRPTGCYLEDTIAITIDTVRPVVLLSSLGTIQCLVGSVTLESMTSSPDLTYQWNTIDGNITSSTSLANVEVDQAGVYELIAVDPNNNCSDTSTIMVSEEPNDLSGIMIESQSPGCQEDDNNGSITVTGGQAPLLYSIGGDFGGSNEFTNLSPDDYVVIVEDQGGCRDSIAIQLERVPSFLIDLGRDTAIELGQSIQLFAETSLMDSEVLRYTWNFQQDDGCQENCAGREITLASDAVIVVEVESQLGCIRSDSLTIEIAGPPSQLISVPSAFSPNGDGMNDLLEIFPDPRIAQIEQVRIFDRWGSQVHQVSNLTWEETIEIWDGSYENSKLDQGVYVYVIESYDRSQELHVFSGTVTLVR